MIFNVTFIDDSQSKVEINLSQKRGLGFEIKGMCRQQNENKDFADSGFAKSNESFDEKPIKRVKYIKVCGYIVSKNFDQKVNDPKVPFHIPSCQEHAFGM